MRFFKKKYSKLKILKQREESFSPSVSPHTKEESAYFFTTEIKKRPINSAAVSQIPMKLDRISI